jgi:cell wall-associated NlpC family hydrolase
MHPYFFSDERQQALWVEANRWLGTPFFPHASDQGHGVDCVNLVHEVFVALGAIPRLSLPDYSLDRSRHSCRTQLLEFLLFTPALSGRFVMVPPCFSRPGDILGIRSGHVDHHLALVLPWNKVIHAVEDAGVILTQANDAHLAKRVLYVLRFMEEQT